jgi:hypothetical protein
MNIKPIEELLEGLQWLFGIQNYERSILVKDKDEEKEDGTSCAEIYFGDKYQEIELTLYPSFFKKNLEEQRKVILHELCHTLTIPSKDAGYKLLNGGLVTPRELDFINEKETSQLENILDGLLRGRLKYSLEVYQNYGKTKKRKNRK